MSEVYARTVEMLETEKAVLVSYRLKVSHAPSSDFLLALPDYAAPAFEVVCS